MRGGTKEARQNLFSILLELQKIAGKLIRLRNKKLRKGTEQPNYFFYITS